MLVNEKPVDPDLARGAESGGRGTPSPSCVLWRRVWRIRWGWRIATSVLLSVLFTWLTAWLVALRTYGGPGYLFECDCEGSYLDANNQRIHFHWRTRGRSPYPGQPGERFVIGHSDQVDQVWKSIQTADFTLCERRRHRFGLPFTSMSWDLVRSWRRDNGISPPGTIAWEHYMAIDASTAAWRGYSWPAPNGGSFELPTKVLWRGFAMDMAVWTVVCLTLLAGPAALRRWNRVRRGQCIECGYNLTGNVSGVCPECGSRLMGSQPHA